MKGHFIFRFLSVSSMRYSDDDDDDDDDDEVLEGLTSSFYVRLT